MQGVGVEFTHRWTLADEALRSVAGHRTGASILTGSALTTVKHLLTAQA